MEKIIVITFETEPKAYEGIRALRRLDADGSIAINQASLVRRNADGSVETVESGLEGFPLRTLAGTGLGALIGVLGGPVGVAVGAGMGAYAGYVDDVVVATLDDDFVTDIKAALVAGTAAVILDVDEEWVTPIDNELETLATFIVRRPKLDVEDELLARRADAGERELAALDEEMKTANAERKAKLRARSDALKARLSKQVSRLDEKKKRVNAENEAKAEALRQKITTSTTEARSQIQSRLDALGKADLEFSTRVDNAVGERLRALAKKIDRKSA